MDGSERFPARVPAGTAGIVGTALATVLVLAMLGALVAIVVAGAAPWFWPAPVVRVELEGGTVLYGRVAGREPAPGGGVRVKLRAGARDLDGREFLWLDPSEIVRLEPDPEAVRVERAASGDVYGRLVRAWGPEGEPVDPRDPRELGRLLERGRELRREARRLERRRDRVRRPLTRLEEEAHLVERGRAAGTAEGKARLEELERRIAAEARRLGPELDAIAARLREARARLGRGGLEVDAGRGRVTVPLGAVIEVTRPGDLGTAGKVWYALRRAAAFLVTEPREANTEGGIFPALFGTVLLVLLMSVAVVPLGVVAAVYMTEYAREGWLLRLATQAVHNLAGVPSIVFGMFGLGFFVYGVGGTLDRLLYPERLPTPTLGTGGILWASLTLALLTLPVVVVATREGLLAVPREWRDGALALGATRWQTLRRVVLPAAMPGVLTGLILAVSRAAGEVAPLMLTGAVKLAPQLPLDGSPPFLHLERKFMHLGFAIYDVSMQSPNVEAAKPMAFATTLVLLLLVVAMNLTAIVVRRRLGRRFRGGAV